MEKEKDILKSFIKDNKDAFDDQLPPMMDFSNIAKETAPKKGKMISIKWLYAVAAIFVLALSAIGFSIFFNNNNSVEVTQNNTTRDTEVFNEFNLSELSPEMAELESYYLQQVALKHAELEKLGIDEELANELEFLDEEFAALKNELGESVDNHLIVNEMIKNYKLKLDLLESVLSDMQNNYDNKNLTQHKDDETYTTYY